DSSMQVYERIAELPFWEEYGEDIRSDVADIRNLSKSRGGGTITAGKFLAHFTNYPFIHLDIATMAYMDARESYLGKGATGVGVRLLYHFLSRRYQKD
ncbi:MAG: peptidase M17, partial [Bacteroidota bacterium]